MERTPGIEPGSLAWKARASTNVPRTHLVRRVVGVMSYDVVEVIYLSIELFDPISSLIKYRGDAVRFSLLNALPSLNITSDLGSLSQALD